MKKIKFNNKVKVNIFKNHKELYHSLSLSLIKEINSGTCIISGGNTPLKLYKILNENDKIKKNRKVILSDDRLVENNNELSNFKMISKNLKINFDPTCMFSYYDLINNYGLNNTLKYLSENILKNNIECSLLGLGTDSHTASLFPENKKILINHDLGFINKNSSEDFKRFSLSFKTLLSSKKIIFLVLGQEKNFAMKSIFSNVKNYLKYPAQKIIHEHDNIELFCDIDASKNLFT